VNTYLDGDIPKEIYLKQKDALMRASLATKEKLKDAERGRNNWIEPLRQWILDTKQADILSQSEDYHQIKSFVFQIGTNPYIFAKSVSFGASAPSELAASRQGFLPARPVAAHCAATLSEREVSICGEGGTPPPPKFRAPLRRRRNFSSGAGVSKNMKQFMSLEYPSTPFRLYQ